MPALTIENKSAVSKDRAMACFMRKFEVFDGTDVSETIVVSIIDITTTKYLHRFDTCTKIHYHHLHHKMAHSTFCMVSKIDGFTPDYDADRKKNMIYNNRLLLI